MVSWLTPEFSLCTTGFTGQKQEDTKGHPLSLLINNFCSGLHYSQNQQSMYKYFRLVSNQNIYHKQERILPLLFFFKLARSLWVAGHTVSPEFWGQNALTPSSTPWILSSAMANMLPSSEFLHLSLVVLFEMFSIYYVTFKICDVKIACISWFFMLPCFLVCLSVDYLQFLHLKTFWRDSLSCKVVCPPGS